MSPSNRPNPHPTGAHAVREALLQAALAEYETARMTGLCRDGAFEAALGAMRRLDLRALPADDDEPARELESATRDLAARFAEAGPPAAGSAAAVTGALAAGLLEWCARLAARRGPAPFRRRAAAIADRGAVAAARLAVAARTDAESVREALRRTPGGGVSEAPSRLVDSALEVAGQCARVASLAAEVAGAGHVPSRADARVAAQLAAAAGACALGLAASAAAAPGTPGGAQGDGLPARSVPAASPARSRRIRRIRMLLERAAVPLDDAG